MSTAATILRDPIVATLTLWAWCMVTDAIVTIARLIQR